MKILVMGLPGSGKTHFASRLSKHLNCAWFNADEVRKMANDWSFSDEGRIRQAYRMRNIADFESDIGNTVVCDFVCPTEETREIFEPDFLIWINTIDKGRFEDTNSVFTPPQTCDIIVDTLLSDKEIEAIARWKIK